MDEKMIRFIDTSYNDLFRVPDGGYVQFDYPTGEIRIRQCHYEDATHLKAGNHLYHFHELATALVRAGGVPTPTEPEIVHGYMITDIHSLGHKSIVLAHNPNAVSPYVTWQQTKGREGYDLGHYYSHRRDAERDFLLRADAERTGADYTPYMPPQKNRDDAR